MTWKKTKHLIKIFCITAVLLLSKAAVAQSIQGVVKNQEATALDNVSVIIKNSENKTIAYQFTKNNGSFIFENLEKQIYTLQVNTLGYEKQLITIDLTQEINKKTEVVLIEKEELLEEIIIEYTAPIREKNDTVVFNVKAFADGTENVVEDLLKKIPGVQVSENGTVKIGNQEIEKIMIEGDDFFEKGYKLLSKNMPVKPLKTVELLKNYSNNKHLKGIENSDKVALNLTLEDDAKREWFGNVNAGYGVVSENRYTVRSNLMNFSKKSKYYFLTNLNNLGEDATGDIGHLIRSSNDYVIGDNQSSNKYLSLSPSTASLGDNRTNFNNAEMLSLNSIFTLSPKTKLKAIAFLNTNEQNYFRNSYDKFSDGITQFENTEDYKMRQKQFTIFGKIDLTHDFNKKSTLEVTTRYNYNTNKDASNINFNNENLEERLKTNTNYFDTKAVYTVKPTDKKVWILAGRFISEETPQNYNVNQFVYQDLFNTNAEAVKQSSNDKMIFFGFEAKFLDKRSNGHLIEFNIGTEFRHDNLNTSFALINNNSEIYPDRFQNQLKFQNNNIYANLSYAYQFSEAFRLVPNVKLNYLNQELTSYNDSKKYNPFLINPGISFNWDINRKNRINGTYGFNWQTNDFMNMNPNYIHTGFRSFSLGYADFTKFANHNANIGYAYGNWSDRFIASAFIGYSYADKYFSSKSTLAQNYSLSEPIVLNDRDIQFYNITIDYYFKFIRTNLKLNFGGNASKFQNYVNDSDIRNITSNGIDYGFELRSGFNGIFNYHVGSKWNYSEFKTNYKVAYTNNRSFVNLTFRFNKKLFATLRNERYYFGGLSQGKKDFYFSDFNINYNMNDKIQFEFMLNNIFNNDTFRSYSITDISVSETNYKLISRYALLKVSYRF